MRRNTKLLLLDKNHVESLLTPAAVLEAVRDAFKLHSLGEGRVFPVVREKLPSGGVFGIKSGDIVSQDVLGFKAAGFWATNRALGGEPHQALHWRTQGCGTGIEGGIGVARMALAAACTS